MPYIHMRGPDSPSSHLPSPSPHAVLVNVITVFLRNQCTAQNLSLLAYCRSEESFHVHCVHGAHVHHLW